MKKRIIQILVAVLILSIAPFAAPQAKAATPDDVASYAKKFLGVPYRFGGTTPSGFDCSGYIRYVFNHFNIDLPRTSAEQYNVGSSVSKSDLQPGDLVFFKNTYKKGISHTGIYLGNGNVISAENEGIAISNINTNPYWGPRYAGAKRLSQVKESLPPVTNGQFADVSSTHPAHIAIRELNIGGIVNGFENQEFRPNESVTRGQAAAMINRTLNLKATKAVKFSDVASNHSFANDIAAMNEAGILKGYTNGRFGMYDTLTKSQLAVILDRAFKTSEASDELVHTASIKYYDVAASYWAFEPIVALKAIDQTSLFQTSNFQVDAETSRAEFSAALYSAMSIN
ncbi:NlpC/P60 family protein [Chungangia koreensis]|uniref:NlpC/P60 family protein n=1 Tax=Chungangia koreensis TaxID=752657 RepID=A0ABV8X4C3_9LACT